MKKYTLAFLLIASCLSVTAETMMDLLQQRIKESDPVAQTLLGLMHEHGYSVEYSEAKARIWYEKGRAGGDQFASSRLKALEGDRSRFETDIKPGSSKTGPSPHSSTNVFKKASLSVTAETMMDLFQRRIRERDPMAQTLLGLMYEHGCYVERSEDKAKIWYEKGRAGGDEFANSRLQILNEELSLFGRSIKTSPSKTDPSAHSSTNVFEAASLSVTAETMMGLLQQRIKESDPVAQTLLGLMYEHGCYVERSEDKARMWYEKSSAEGDEFASSRLLALEGDISRFETDIKPVSSKPGPSSHSSTNVFTEAGFAELVSKTFDMEKFQLKQSTLVGKVVKLKFDSACFYGSGANPQLTVHDQNYRFSQSIDLPDDEDALDWAVEYNGENGGDSVYIFVQSNEKIYALGTRKHKTGDSYTYTW